MMWYGRIILIRLKSYHTDEVVKVKQVAYELYGKLIRDDSEFLISWISMFY